MKTKALHILRTRPIFLYLLPVFFVLHGYTENYDFVPVNDAVILLATYLIASLILSLLTWIFYRDFTKANLLAFCMMAFHFFFGAVQDLIKKISPDIFILKYSFILPCTAILFIVLLISLKKTKKSFLKITLFTNLLLLLFILADSGWLLLKVLTVKEIKRAPVSGLFKKCDNCKYPDVYLIMADGYPGQTELKAVLGYDNQLFEQELEKRGFHVIDSSRSNYNLTPFSVASMLDMDYLKGIAGQYSNKNDIALCYNTIKQSKLFSFLTQAGYKIYNYSIFDLSKQPSLATPTFLPRKSKPITSQTFISRAEKEIGFHLATTFRIKSIIRYVRNHDLKNNRKLTAKTIKIAKEATSNPKFVYTHLIMPHYPYYFDSTGQAVSYEKITDDFIVDQGAMISYLKYSNTKLIELVDQIKSSAASPPIIILMSDHGFREFKVPVDNKYHFYNLNAVFFPDSNYSLFYNGMTNINQFRVILNSQFGQQLPLLKDSTSFLLE